MRELSLQTADGTTLSATLFEPEGEAKAAALIVPAMGVAQRFYASFATWLAARGVLVLTFDYRGIGASRQGSLAELDTDILTWAAEDTAAAVDAISAVGGDLPLTWLGHSLGGQLVGLVPNHGKAAKIVTIACGSGYWRDNALRTRWKVLAFWYGFVPVATALFGYFPGRRLRMVGDLPRRVILQFRRWCLNADYMVGVEGPDVRERLAAVATPITALSFTDDEMMSERSIESLHAWYSGAPREMHRVAPREVGLRRVGHLGFFRRELAEPLWHAFVPTWLAQG